ncbi:Hypothetical predicted protein [Paramuricea clavata]|uniref:Uncharacterized protein n=1 Tax=Paramuricea clavata TaxID=317549 RepID=A0A6S7GPS7_PARCT|nr:Hypothetical predicted protein [Paramuricea clavata]
MRMCLTQEVGNFLVINSISKLTRMLNQYKLSLTDTDLCGKSGKGKQETGKVMRGRYDSSSSTDHRVAISNTLVREKPDRRIRIDPSRTVNKAIRRHVQPVPTIEENLPFLRTSAKVFTVEDVSEAFHNIELNNESSLLTTFQSPNERYRYKRISSGREEYQRRQQEFLEK